MPTTKVLLITRNFPPQQGGMERLNWHMADELRTDCLLRVIGPSGASETAPPQVDVLEAGLKPLSSFLFKAAYLALREALRWKPDIVLAGSGLTAPIALAAARICNARAVAYVHGLDITVPHPVYQAIWRPLLCRMDSLIANSRATVELARMAGARTERITVVHPGVALPKLVPGMRATFRQRLDLGDRPILLSVGRLTARKGLLEFVRDALPAIVASRPDTLFLVIGDVPANALFGEAQTPSRILEQARASGVERNIRFLGTVSDSELAEAYAGADVYVFPVRKLPNDPEGFGMVAIEAAAHGLPTVAYATGGVVDAVGPGISGALIEPEDSDAFSAAVLEFLATPPDRGQVREFASTFCWDAFGLRLSEALGLPRIARGLPGTSSPL